MTTRWHWLETDTGTHGSTDTLGQAKKDARRAAGPGGSWGAEPTADGKTTLWGYGRRRDLFAVVWPEGEAAALLECFGLEEPTD